MESATERFIKILDTKEFIFIKSQVSSLFTHLQSINFA